MAEGLILSVFEVPQGDLGHLGSPFRSQFRGLLVGTLG